MKKALISLFYLIFSIEVSYSETLTLSINTAAPPLQMYDEKNQKATGIIVELIQLALKETEHKLQVIYAPQARLTKLHNEKVITKAISYGSPSWDNTGSGYLPPKLFDWKTKLIFSKKNPLNYNDIKSLMGKRLVLIRGYNYPAVQSLIKNRTIEVYYVKTTESALKFLSLNRADAFIAGNMRIHYHIDRIGLKIEDFDFISLDKNQPTNIHIWVDETVSQEVKSLISKKMIEFKKSGLLKKLF
jgi:polar amino acid transport system substrate-binding protein